MTSVSAPHLQVHPFPRFLLFSSFLDTHRSWAHLRQAPDQSRTLRKASLSSEACPSPEGPGLHPTPRARSSPESQTIALSVRTALNLICHSKSSNTLPPCKSFRGGRGGDKDLKLPMRLLPCVSSRGNAAPALDLQRCKGLLGSPGPSFPLDASAPAPGQLHRSLAGHPATSVFPLLPCAPESL